MYTPSNSLDFSRMRSKRCAIQPSSDFQLNRALAERVTLNKILQTVRADYEGGKRLRAPAQQMLAVTDQFEFISVATGKLQK